MEITDLVEKFNILKFNLKFKDCTKHLSKSQEFAMFGSTFFRVGLKQFHGSDCDRCGGRAKTTFYLRFFNRPKSTYKYTIRFSSNALNIKGMLFTSDEGHFHLVKDLEGFLPPIDVEAILDIVPDEGRFVGLYDDTEPTDFQLNGEDGSVSVHRAVLAASSPVLCRMLTGDWKETKEGEIKMHATNKQSLEHLKDYMYLNTIPETEADLEQLLLLSRLYEIPGLERRCVFQLVANMTDDRLRYYKKLAREHNIERLTWAIHFAVLKGALDISQILKEVL